ncbi:MAG: hypothetical protein E7593_05470 [Ruminococcaceae bacterium]|nr:hypothetical protein [Oscillospiraceae bacterium]
MKKIIFVPLVFVILLSLLCVNVFAYSDDYLYDDEYYEYGEEEEYYIDEVKEEFNVGKKLLISFIVGLVLALIITGIMRSGMKSVRFQNAARNYIKQDSMVVSKSMDLYLYSRVTKVAIPKNNNRK